MSVLVSIDPGRDKCGIAVVSESGVLHKAVVARADVARTIAALAAVHRPSRIIVGSGTSGSELARTLRAVTDIPIELVDERNSTLRARARFFEENPPRGLLRLVPRGMLTPPCPYDDYVALILAEDYMKQA